MRKAVFHHLHGAGGSWEGQVIEVDESSRRAGIFSTYTAYLDGDNNQVYEERGQVYEEELTWLDEVEPTDGELLDAFDAEEDVPLVIGGKLTEAGIVYIVDSRRLAEAEAETWIIEDWMSNRVFPEMVFASFLDARGYISDYAETVSEGDDYEFSAICEDLYAVQINEED